MSCDFDMVIKGGEIFDGIERHRVKSLFLSVN